MNLRSLLFMLLVLSVTTHEAPGSTVLDFTSGTITNWSAFWPVGYQPYPEFLGAGLEYLEKGVTVTSLNANEEYGLPCFFLDGGGLNLAMESGPVEFTAGGLPFDLISIDTSWLGTPDPNFGPYTFTTSNGGSIDVDVNGTFVFPQTSQWRNITAFQWTPHIFGLIDNVKLDGLPIPEPSTISLLIIGTLFLFAAARRKGK
jgi:hypothetical protein